MECYGISSLKGRDKNVRFFNLLDDYLPPSSWKLSSGSLGLNGSKVRNQGNELTGNRADWHETCVHIVRSSVA